MSDFTKAAQALSDETRLRILNLILFRECCVCEVMQALEISHTRASRNLKILYEAGFLSMRTDGLFTLYAIASNADDSLHALLLTAVGAYLGKNAYARQDLDRLKEARRIGPDGVIALKPRSGQGGCECKAKREKA